MQILDSYYKDYVLIVMEQGVIDVMEKDIIISVHMESFTLI